MWSASSQMLFRRGVGRQAACAARHAAQRAHGARARRASSSGRAAAAGSRAAGPSAVMPCRPRRVPALSRAGARAPGRAGGRCPARRSGCRRRRSRTSGRRRWRARFRSQTPSQSVRAPAAARGLDGRVHQRPAPRPGRARAGRRRSERSRSGAGPVTDGGGRSASELGVAGGPAVHLRHERDHPRVAQLRLLARGAEVLATYRSMFSGVLSRCTSRGTCARPAPPARAHPPARRAGTTTLSSAVEPRRAKPRVDVAGAEGARERVKGRLARAMARRDQVEPPGVVKRGRDPRDLRVGRRHEVEAAEDLVHVIAVRPGGLEDGLDARMGAADEHHQPLGRPQHERELAQLQRARRPGDGGDQRHAGRDLGQGVDPDEVRARPDGGARSSAGTTPPKYRIRRGQRRVGPDDRGGTSPPKMPKRSFGA